jgi:hypothetical protein
MKSSTKLSFATLSLLASACGNLGTSQSDDKRQPEASAVPAESSAADCNRAAKVEKQVAVEFIKSCLTNMDRTQSMSNVNM